MDSAPFSLFYTESWSDTTCQIFQSTIVFTNIATRGRKFGIHLLLATQRPASIHKEVLSQCNRWWFGGVTSTQDCNALKDYLAEAGVSVEQIRNQTPGQFYFYSQGKTELLKVRKRKCRHGGVTPTEAEPLRKEKMNIQTLASKLGTVMEKERA